MNGRTVRSAAKGRSLTSGSLEDGLVARPVLQFINERGSSSCLAARRLPPSLSPRAVPLQSKWTKPKETISIFWYMHYVHFSLSVC